MYMYCINLDVFHKKLIPVYSNLKKDYCYSSKLAQRILTLCKNLLYLTEKLIENSQ